MVAALAEPVMTESEPKPEKHSMPVEPSVEQPEPPKSVDKSSFLKGMLSGAAIVALLALGIGLISRCSGNGGEALQSPQASVEQKASSDSEPSSEPEKPVVVTDTTSATKYLTTIAEHHYGNQMFWVYIYQENKDHLDRYDNIPVGTVLVIPPPEKYGIDAKDPESVKRAGAEAFRMATEQQNK